MLRSSSVFSRSIVRAFLHHFAMLTRIIAVSLLVVSISATPPTCEHNSWESFAPASPSVYEYDLIVIGGGSGGLSCSKTASSLGVRVSLVDAVSPSPIGSTWGIGGTCANVGCIPKKLFHQATLVGRDVEYAEKYGWKGVKKGEHDWNTLVKVVNDRIKANNWVYRVQLNQKGVSYHNGFASFVDQTTIRVESADKKKTTSLLRAPSIVISTGLRPRYPDIPGSELGITSDDIFTLNNPPGRTLVVGGSYVALETAGMLKDLGFHVDLMIRSVPLKGFDVDMVDQVMSNLFAHGVNIKQGYNLVKAQREGDKKMVTFTTGIDKHTETESYDTIVWAIGREPRLQSLNLPAVKVLTSARSGKILANDEDCTSTDGIYAVGDVVEGRPELTPSAIRSGFLLAQRLFGNSKEVMSYDKIATTVFTPLELGTVGLTEERAIEIYGEENLEVFHSFFTPYEFIVSQDPDGANCYAKIIALRSDPRTILGLHLTGPNAAEIIQGYAVAFKKGFTMDDLTSTVAIHPCSSEEIVKLNVTKRSGMDPKVAGCCG